MRKIPNLSLTNLIHLFVLFRGDRWCRRGSSGQFADDMGQRRAMAHCIECICYFGVGLFRSVLLVPGES